MADDDQALATVKRAYEFFASNNFGGIMELIRDDSTWSAPGPKDVLPWVGTCRGPAEIKAMFNDVGNYAQLTLFEPREFISNGRTVAVVGYEEGILQPTGGKYATDFVHIFEIEDGKIKSYQEYNDTAGLVVTMTGKPHQA